MCLSCVGDDYCGIRKFVRSLFTLVSLAITFDILSRVLILVWEHRDESLTMFDLVTLDMFIFLPTYNVFFWAAGFIVLWILSLLWRRKPEPRYIIMTDGTPNRQKTQSDVSLGQASLV